MIISKEDLKKLTDIVDERINEIVDELKSDKESEDEKNDKESEGNKENEKEDNSEEISIVDKIIELSEPLKQIAKSVASLSSGNTLVTNEISSKLTAIVKSLDLMRKLDEEELSREKKEKEGDGDVKSKKMDMHKKHLDEMISIKSVLSKISQIDYTNELKSISESVKRTGEIWEFSVMYNQAGFIEKVVATKK